MTLKSPKGVSQLRGSNVVPRDHYDPDQFMPRLPMPYRMIDNVLRDLIEEALELARDDPPREEPIEAIKPTFSLDIPDIVTVQPSNDGMMLYVGTKQGKLLCINTLRGEQVGNPIDLEDTIKCLALAADGRILAVAVGGAKEGDEAEEPTPSTVKLMLVLSERPFLKTVASTPLIAEAVELHLSFDSQVFAALLKTNQLECYSTTISIPLADEAAEPLSSPVKAPHASAQLQGDEDGDEKPPPEPTVSQPVRVLLTPILTPPPDTQPRPTAGGATDPEPLPPDTLRSRAVVLLGRCPRVRQVGQLQEQHCAHVNVAILGGYFVEKFTFRHNAAGDSVNEPPKAQPWENLSLRAPAPPVVGPDESRALVQLRMPHAVTAVAQDGTTVLLFTGLVNGVCVVWNNVRRTQLHVLR